jgi:glycosyltransferase involved in cell wall biosynthesis
MNARLVVAPLKIARGVQNKVLEAMAAGRPIVATPAANAGIDALDGREILLAEAAGDFAAAALRVLDDARLSAALGAAARARALADFTWERQFQRLDSLVSALVGAGATASAGS